MKKLLKKIIPASTILFYHRFNGFLAAYFYRFPAKKLRVFGITGTNGKTTTCHLLANILETAGLKVGMMTTIDFKIGGPLVDNNLKMTTPNPWFLQKMLKKMVNAGCTDAIVEVTSIALDQNRLYGIPFYGVAFTNLTHDHLDYHKNMEQYRLAKEKLFATRPALSVINIDDESAPFFLKHTANRTITYGITDRADVMAKKVFNKPGGTDFVMLIGQTQTSVNLNIPGQFNVYNALAAASLALGVGLSLEDVTKGLHDVEGVAGRMEVIDVGQPFTVIVDYAHSPDALQKVYQVIRPTVRGKLISVLGSAGDRDKTKRPILGSLAGRFADYVFITNEDPYSEDPMSIIEQVAEGVPKGRPKRGRMKVNKESEVTMKYRETGEGLWWWKILDRREALTKALEMARPIDVVLVTGKGAENVMVVGDKHIPWNDRKVLEELLAKYKVD